MECVLYELVIEYLHLSLSWTSFSYASSTFPRSMPHLQQSISRSWTIFMNLSVMPGPWTAVMETWFPCHLDLLIDKPPLRGNAGLPYVDSYANFNSYFCMHSELCSIFLAFLWWWIRAQVMISMLVLGGTCASIDKLGIHMGVTQ